MKEISADEYLSRLSPKDAQNLEDFTNFIRSRRSKHKGIRFGLVVADAVSYLLENGRFVKLVILTSTEPLSKERTVVIPLREDVADFFKAQNPVPAKISNKIVDVADIVVSYSDRLPLRIYFGSFTRTPDMDTMISELREHNSPFVLLHRDRLLPLTSAPSLDEARGKRR